jgi:hypothetical protein
MLVEWTARLSEKGNAAMDVEAIMEKHGFRLSASCGGQAAYTKTLMQNGRRALLSVTARDGEGLPASMDEPVRVGVSDLRSGDDLEASQQFSSLTAYLESLPN